MNLVISAAWGLAAAGIVLGAGSVIVFRRPLVALRMMLEFFTAAGLLRLSADVSWETIAAAGALIAVRQVVTRTLAADLRSPTPAGALSRSRVRW